ncbi:ABC transporter ATP-binding protein/permease [Nocardia sp. NPDC051756]|uniref:ABC transporter ATP-binding protein/permease n=1 Tax=Nocardia sp. NPDC051756 TaxID=3154751 RepID=UPI003429C30B
MSTAEPGAAPLVGVDEMTTPTWMTVDQQVAAAGLWRTLLALPAGARVVIGLAWQASARLTVGTVLLAVAGGCATAFGLLATADVLGGLLAQGPTPDRVVSALPSVGLVAGALAVRALIESATATAEALLKPRAERIARDKAHTAIARVELVAFEDSHYADLVRQGLQRGMGSIARCVQAIVGISGAAIHVIAAVTTTAVLHPLLAPLVLLAVLPELWASARAAKLSYQSYIRTVTRNLRTAIASELLSGRDTAAELRSCTAGPALLAEYRRISDQLTDETSRVELARARVRLAGRTVAGVGTGLAYGVLGLLLYLDALPLALAGTAVVAMRMAAAALSQTMIGINSLYENILYLEFYANLLEQTERHTRPPATGRAPADPREITLDSVSFTYPGQDEPAVRAVNVTIGRGEIVALVGENGSGKSTLAKLITGLYLPTNGQVRWDGVDLATVDEQSIYRRIAMVMQDPARWPMTARDNIRIGRIERTDPEGTTPELPRCPSQLREVGRVRHLTRPALLDHPQGPGLPIQAGTTTDIPTGPGNRKLKTYTGFHWSSAGRVVCRTRLTSRSQVRVRRVPAWFLGCGPVTNASDKKSGMVGCGSVVGVLAVVVRTPAPSITLLLPHSCFILRTPVSFFAHLLHLSHIRQHVERYAE